MPLPRLRLFRAFLILALLAPVLASIPGESAARRPLVIGHRGAWGRAPENTLTGFRTAMNLGADMLEMDVRLTAPDRLGAPTLVVFHDRTLTRATNCRGYVSQASLARIKRCDAGYGTKNPSDARPWRHRGIQVPTLKQVFGKYPRTPLLLEMKYDPEKTDDLVSLHAVARSLASFLTARYDAGDRTVFKRVIVASLESSSLDVIKALEQRVITALVVGSEQDTLATGYVRSTVLRHDMAVPSVKAADLTASSVAAMRKAGYKVIVHTADAPATIRRVLSLGVDGLYTNYPDRVRAAMRQTGFKSSRACLASICI